MRSLIEREPSARVHAIRQNRAGAGVQTPTRSPGCSQFVGEPSETAPNDVNWLTVRGDPSRNVAYAGRPAASAPSLGGARRQRSRRSNRISPAAAMTSRSAASSRCPAHGRLPSATSSSCARRKTSWPSIGKPASEFGKLAMRRSCSPTIRRPNLSARSIASNGRRRASRWKSACGTMRSRRRFPATASGYSCSAACRSR